MSHNKIALTVVFIVAAAIAVLAPLTNAPEPTTWILSMALIVLGTALAKPAARGERLPPGVA